VSETSVLSVLQFMLHLLLWWLAEVVQWLNMSLLTAGCSVTTLTQWPWLSSAWGNQDIFLVVLWKRFVTMFSTFCSLTFTVSLTGTLYVLNKDYIALTSENGTYFGSMKLHE